MTTTQPCTWAALFDLDGVVFDTEPQYTRFWAEQGRRFRPDVDYLALRIKGQTLDHILATWFAHIEGCREELLRALDDFERNMNYPCIPGFEAFLQELHERGVKTAVVTSSNQPKMQHVYREHPDFAARFDAVLTSERFSRSKPAPDPYLLGAEVLQMPVQQCVVFEDSLNGLRSGQSAGMCVVGLSTTNAAADIAPLCRLVAPDFTALTVPQVEALLTTPQA